MKYSLLVLILICSIKIGAQELNLDVKVNLPSTQTADPRVFQTLERQVKEFFNQTQWTDDEFEDDEKIEANLQITIKEEISTTSFKADFIFQVIRPVYDAAYSTQLFNHIDKDVSFTYTEFQPIQNNKDLYTDHLSSLLSFYAYIMIGVDYDSFSPQGGDQSFQQAKTVALNVPTSQADNGWALQATRRNRHKLIDNILHPNMRPYRQAFYDYHRKGLDMMTDDPLKARAVISSALNAIQAADASYPNSLLIQIFCDAKAGEIVEIFKPSKAGEKRKAFDIMTSLDPAKSDKYFAIKP